MTIALLICVLLQPLIAPPASTLDIGNFWPAVAPLHKSVEIRDPRKVSLDIEIKDATGSPVYLLQCRSGNYGGSDFDYSGLIQCRLTSLYSHRRDAGERYNALTYDPHPGRDWESRARFLIPELTGRCADYPDWGKVRHFRLRGMNLTLAIDDLKFDHVPPDSAGTPLSYRFSVEVKPDSSALSAIEGDSHFAEPLKNNGNADCARVVAEHVPGEATDEYIRSHDLQAPYPEIVANKASLTFVIGKKDQFPELAILGHDRKPVYTLKCSADIWIAGTPWAIRCGLFAEGSRVDLLEDSVDPYTRESRAVFQGIHTNQTCRDYPQWGASRDFELRGMKISIAESGDFENDLWALGSADRAFGRTVKLHVQVTPEPPAESPVAMPIKIVDWLLLQRHESCKEILTH